MKGNNGDNGRQLEISARVISDVSTSHASHWSCHFSVEILWVGIVGTNTVDLKVDTKDVNNF